MIRMKGRIMSKFWQNWMSAWAIFVTLFGLALAGGAFEASDGITRALFTLFGNPMPESPDQLHRFAIGLMGAVTMGWGLTYFVVFKALHHLERATAAPLWRMVTFAAVIWYLVDSAISCATGYSMNAASNTLLLIGYFIPVIKSGVMRGSTSG
jgi:hypothetical protein